MPTDAVTENYGPGLTAFLIVAGLAVALFFLVRSMLTHINKVPPSFDEPAERKSGDEGSGPTEPDGG